VWALLGVLMLSVMIDVRLTVLFSYQSNDQYSRSKPPSRTKGLQKLLR
jgi:putative ATP-binding cassette transporter